MGQPVFFQVAGPDFSTYTSGYPSSALLIYFIQMRKLFQIIGMRQVMPLWSGLFPTARTTMAGEKRD